MGVRGVGGVGRRFWGGGWVGSWWSILFRLSIRSAWWRAALKRALSHWSAERPCAVRSWLSDSKSWRSESFIWSCACALEEKKKTNAAAKKTFRFLVAARENFSFLVAPERNLKFRWAAERNLEFLTLVKISRGRELPFNL